MKEAKMVNVYNNLVEKPITEKCEDHHCDHLHASNVLVIVYKRGLNTKHNLSKLYKKIKWEINILNFKF